jgi:hypothetical protein
LNSALAAEIQRLGGDAGDEVWRWFVLNGPHGSHFTWGQTRDEPPGYVGVDHLQLIVAEKAESDSTFLVRARAVVLKGLSSMDLNVLRRAIQVAAVVGGDAELERVTALTTHGNEVVAADARASAFYLRKQLRAKRE